jgi:hypothetical protein
MGNIKHKKTPKNKLKNARKGRKLNSKGQLKKKRGDVSLVGKYMVGYDVKQKKGGKWVRASGVRKCKIHTVCNCVVRSDPTKMQRITNR